MTTNLLTALLALPADRRQAVLDDVAARTGQRARRAALIRRFQPRRCLLCTPPLNGAP